MVFAYLDIFATDKATVAEMKAHYQRGGLGDMKVKRYLLEVLEAKFGPIRERRAEFAQDKAAVMEILRQGSLKAKAVAAQTLYEVRKAIGVEYF
jgi:tryptophanyl-tRNA synthetase